MDPNANLEEQRRIVARLQAAEDSGSIQVQDLAREAERLADLVQALDEWLTRGGFLPTAWKQSISTRL